MAVKKRKKAYWPLAGGVIFLSCFLYINGAFLSSENKYLDFLFKARLFFFGVERVDERLTVIGIDEASLLEFGKMPWPRSLWAYLLEKLMAHEPAVVALDILFPEPDQKNPIEDKRLIEVTKKYKDKIVHSFYESVQTLESGQHILPQVTVLKPFNELLKVTENLGFVDTQRLEGDRIVQMTDADGSVRRAFLYKMTAENKLALSLGARAFALSRGLGVKKFSESNPDEIIINFPGIELHKTPSGRHVFRQPYNMISCRDILKDKADPEKLKKLKNGIVFVASVATGAYDHFPTPYEALTPGVAIHLYVANNLSHSNAIRELPATLMLLTVVLGGIILAVTTKRLLAKANSFIFIAMITSFFTLSLLLLKQNYLFNTLAPFVSCVALFLTLTIYRIVAEEKEKRWIRSTFNQYLSPKVVSLLVENPELLELGGQKKEMTVFFLDIVNFTVISEKLSAENLTKMLNHYLTRFTQIILRYDGVVDKFMGDSVMAFWNAPFDQKGHALNACLAALDIIRDLKETSSLDFPPITVRVGINSGEMVVGNMGSAARFNYTVIGDNVNLASRLEGANKFFKTSILITEATLNLTEKAIATRRLGRVRVVGKEIPVSVFEVIGKSVGEKNLDFSLWVKAIEALDGDLRQEARKLFQDWLKLHSEDQVAQIYMKMLEDSQTQDFVINLESK